MKIHSNYWEEQEEVTTVPGPMVSITFDMSDDTQLYTYNQMMQAHQMHSALDEFAQILRSMDKYCVHPIRNDELSIEESSIIGEIREMFWETVNESGADIT